MSFKIGQIVCEHGEDFFDLDHPHGAIAVPDVNRLAADPGEPLWPVRQEIEARSVSTHD